MLKLTKWWLLILMGPMAHGATPAAADGGPGCSTVFGAKVKPKRLVERANPPYFEPIYFTLTRQFQNGDFSSLENALPALEALHIKHYWTSPWHPQSVNRQRNPITGELNRNDHGYWPLNTSQVAKHMGGEAGLKAFTAAAKTRDISVIPDLVLGHLGYHNPKKHFLMEYTREDGSVVRERLLPNDRTMFRAPYPTNLDFKSLYERMENARDLPELLALLRILATVTWDPGLLVRHHGDYDENGTFHINKKAFDADYNVIRAKIDKGRREFRIDAGKHQAWEYVVAIINATGAYCARKGLPPPRFIAEYWFANSRPLSLIANHILSNVTGAHVYFFDFPAATIFRNAVLEPFADLRSVERSIVWREANMEAVFPHIITGLEDHDFLTPINDAWLSVFGHMMASFFAHNAPILYHGGEQPGSRPTSRAKVDQVNPYGIVGVKLRDMRTKVHQHLREGAKSRFLWSDHSTLVAQRDGIKENFLLFVRKDPAPFDVTINLPETTDPQSLREEVVYYGSPEAEVGFHAEIVGNGKQIRIRSRGRMSVVLRKAPLQE